MFPISDSIVSRKFPFVTLSLIIVNVIVFILELSAVDVDQFILRYSLIPANVDFKSLSTLSPFVTSLFLHGGFIHIISNMWFLWIFGDDVEDYYGNLKFMLLYFAAGIFGSLAEYAFNQNSTIPMLGASGAISGILGAYMVLYPHSKIKSLLFIFIFITIIELPALFFLFYWFFVQLFSGIAALGSVQQGGIAFWAHIVGFLIGALSAKTFKESKPTPDKDYIEGETV